MPRKIKRGYYVKGHFVAEGSELDVELKAELKGTYELSKTDLKRESDKLQAIGESLLTLRADLLAGLGLSDKLMDAIADAKRITNFEGRRRQMQFIGKLMRLLDDDTVRAAEAALEAQHKGSAEEKLALHLAEQWRDRLLADDDAVGQWVNASPGTDVQQLRALIRQARKDAKPEKPGMAPRHGRAYRDIFQMVRERLTHPGDGSDATALPGGDLPHNPGADA